LRSEIPSGMCAKLRTVAASNNRDHPTRSLYYCHLHIFLFFAHIPFVVNHTINATPPERLQQHLSAKLFASFLISTLVPLALKLTMKSQLRSG